MTGEVRGKYGYVDAEGNVKETVYGGSAERGFEPQAGERAAAAAPIFADRGVRPYEDNSGRARKVDAGTRSRFANFKARQTPRIGQVVDDEVKIVNGRRAVLKKRLKVTTSGPVNLDTRRRQQLAARRGEEQVASSPSYLTEQQPAPNNNPHLNNYNPQTGAYTLRLNIGQQ